MNNPNIILGVLSLIFLKCINALRITCIGDSITEGGGCAQKSYTYDLQIMLGSEVEVTNAGKSAMTMLKKGLCNDLTNCSYWDTDSWQKALSSKPDIVTIMLGTNDAKTFNWEGIQQNLGDFYALDYVEMIKILQSLQPLPKIYLVIPPPLYPPYPYQMNQTIINNILPILVRNIASNMEVEIIDVFSAFTDAKQTCDGCHPTEVGNNVIASAIYKKLLIDEVIVAKGGKQESI